MSFSQSFSQVLDLVLTKVPSALQGHVNFEALFSSIVASVLKGEGVVGTLEALAEEASTIVAPQYAPALIAAIGLAKEAYSLYTAAKTPAAAPAAS